MIQETYAGNVACYNCIPSRKARHLSAEGWRADLQGSLDRNGGQIAQIVVLTAVGDGFQVFGVAPVGDAHTGDLALFCHFHRLLLFHDGIVGKLIPGDPAAFFHKTCDPFCIGIGLRDLIQCILDEIVIFHTALPLSGAVFPWMEDSMQETMKEPSADGRFCAGYSGV